MNMAVMRYAFWQLFMAMFIMLDEFMEGGSCRSELLFTVPLGAVNPSHEHGCPFYDSIKINTLYVLCYAPLQPSFSPEGSGLTWTAVSVCRFVSSHVCHMYCTSNTFYGQLRLSAVHLTALIDFLLWALKKKKHKKQWYSTYSCTSKTRALC